MIRLFALVFGFVLTTCFASAVSSMGLTVNRAPQSCEADKSSAPVPANVGFDLLPDSQVVEGRRDVAWVWLGGATRRYPHGALGSTAHAGALYVQSKAGSRTVKLELPLNRVFEDRVPRLVDLDADGKDEIVLVESDTLRGAAVVVFGLRDSPLRLVEIARSVFTGSTFRWLNPVGFADFDGDGKLDIASVTTPHIGGELTLYRYAPPNLVVFAKAMDVSNHKMGEAEQSLAAIVSSPKLRPTVIVPDMWLTGLHALRWDPQGKWMELADQPFTTVPQLKHRIRRITGIADGACVLLVDGSYWRVTLTH